MLGATTIQCYYRRAAIRPHGPGAHILSFDGVDIALDFAYPNHRSIRLRGEFQPELTRVLERAVRPLRRRSAQTRHIPLS